MSHDSLEFSSSMLAALVRTMHLFYEKLRNGLDEDKLYISKHVNSVSDYPQLQIV